MKKADIRVMSSTGEELIHWLNGTSEICQLPKASDTTCLWVSLYDEYPLRHETLHENSTQCVVILHQGGGYTHPERIMAELSRYFLQAEHLQQPLWIVMTGNNREQMQSAWTDKFCFVTHGKPPLFRLVVLALGAGVTCSYPWLTNGFPNRMLRKLSRALSLSVRLISR